MTEIDVASARDFTPDATDEPPGGWRALSRGQAFAIHLGLSLLAFSTLVGAMLLFWFPGELFFIAGGIQGLKIVALVDIVLGPLLTLLLFKPGKPGLLMDMTLVAMFQIAALLYGFHTTYQQRTVAIVHAEGVLQTLSADAHAEANAELRARGRHPQQLESAGWLQSNKVITPAPAPGEFGSFMADLLNGYPEPHERSDRYVSFEEHYDSIRSDALDRPAIEAMSIADEVDESLEARGLSADEVDLFHYKTRFSKGVAIVDTTTHDIIDFVPSAAENAAATMAENDGS